MNETYYAKSKNKQHDAITNGEHCRKVAALAKRFGDAFGKGFEAAIAGTFHDFGKYGQTFQDVAYPFLNVNRKYEIKKAPIDDQWVAHKPKAKGIGSSPIPFACICDSNRHNQQTIKKESCQGFRFALFVKTGQ